MPHTTHGRTTTTGLTIVTAVLVTAIAASATQVQHWTAAHLDHQTQWVSYAVPATLLLTALGAGCVHIGNARAGVHAPLWRVLAHGCVAADVAANIAAEWAYGPAAVALLAWLPAAAALLLEALTRQALGERTASDTRVHYRVPGTLWLTRPVWSWRTLLRMRRTGETDARTASAALAESDAAVRLLRIVVARQARARRTRRDVARLLRLAASAVERGALSPVCVRDVALRLQGDGGVHAVTVLGALVAASVSAPDAPQTQVRPARQVRPAPADAPASEVSDAPAADAPADAPASAGEQWGAAIVDRARALYAAHGEASAAASQRWVMSECGVGRPVAVKILGAWRALSE